jgi:hypothetical protein
MSQPIPIPRRQVRAFDLAMAKRLGLDPTEIVDDFTVHFETNDEDMSKVTFTGTAYLPTEEVLAIFNAGAVEAATPPTATGS